MLAKALHPDSSSAKNRDEAMVWLNANADRLRATPKSPRLTQDFEGIATH